MFLVGGFQKKKLHFTISRRPSTAFLENWESKCLYIAVYPVRSCYIMAFFVPFTYVYPFISTVLLTKNNNLWNERKEEFLYIWLLQWITLCQNEVENCIFRQNRIFRLTFMYKQPMLTRKWNYNIFVQILHSSVRYTAQYHSCSLWYCQSFTRNQEGKMDSQKSVCRRKVICHFNSFMTEVPIMKKPAH